MGDLLFSIAQLSRQLGIEPETALRKANDKFTRRFSAMEQAVGDVGPSDEGHDARRARGRVAAGQSRRRPIDSDGITKARRTRRRTKKRPHSTTRSHAVLQDRHVEVHQQPDAQLRQRAGSSPAEPRCSRMEPLHRLDLEDDFRIDNTKSSRCSHRNARHGSAPGSLSPLERDVRGCAVRRDAPAHRRSRAARAPAPGGRRCSSRSCRDQQSRVRRTAVERNLVMHVMAS